MESGISVKPFCWTLVASLSISCLCRRSLRTRSRSWPQRFACEYSLIETLWRNAWPLRNSTKPSAITTRASRSDLTSEPTSWMPASIRSWIVKSCVAFRLVAITLTMSSSRAFTLPLADVLHRCPWLGGRQRLALLQQLDGDQVGRPDECHAAIARRPRDRVAQVDHALARGVDVVDLVRDVAEVAATAVRLLM